MSDSKYSSLPARVKIFEVGPRDGLQNEAKPISVADKVSLINQLSQTGLTAIEAGSFVSAKWVPQMASSDEVLRSIKRKAGVRYSALTPNMQGFDAAMAAGVDEIAVFTAASESFSNKNINCSIADSLQRFAPVAKAAISQNIPLRGYVSCVVDCPYEGRIAPAVVASVSKQLIDLGCYQISLGDTIGTATPIAIQTMLHTVTTATPAAQLAIHCHDTYGQAIANIMAALQCGISTVDSSVAGLGGCPYARGASGNVATEDVLYLLQGLGIETGVDLQKMVSIGALISTLLGRQNQSKAGTALTAKS